ncbi:hypothetical protein ACLBKT_04295 [Erythrobacter sp. W302b]|uniref:hypothetical protein n=1 Tax=Erythrobacter sp. W302b TaxID=3389874 RepID=UPI00396B199E
MHRSLYSALLALPLISAPVMAHEVLHGGHDGHAHAKGCGHQAIDHAGHVDYLHDGHLHHAHDGHVDEHVIEVSDANPDAEELVARVTTDDHPHGHAGEEHMTVQHGDHMDFVHDGHLHHRHGDHTDDHGVVKLVGA